MGFGVSGLAFRDVAASLRIVPGTRTRRENLTTDSRSDFRHAASAEPARLWASKLS